MATRVRGPAPGALRPAPGRRAAVRPDRWRPFALDSRNPELYSRILTTVPVPRDRSRSLARSILASPSSPCPPCPRQAMSPRMLCLTGASYTYTEPSTDVAAGKRTVPACGRDKLAPVSLQTLEHPPRTPACRCEPRKSQGLPDPGQGGASEASDPKAALDGPQIRPSPH